MNKSETLTIAVAVNNIDILRKNLFLSPGILNNHGNNQLIIKENFLSASLAYNSAIDEAENEIVVFIHQDIYLPEAWFSDLQQSLLYLKEAQINWGVLGCFGVRKSADDRLGRVYTNGIGWHGAIIKKPEPVETLDEIILITRKSSGLRFDPHLPHFHLYGTDICILARVKGMTNYAIPASCVHNTNQLLDLPNEFYECYRYVKKKWEKHLPIHTSCTKISRFDKDMYSRKIRKFAGIVLGKKRTPLLRVDDPRSVLGNEFQI